MQGMVRTNIDDNNVSLAVKLEKSLQWTPINNVFMTSNYSLSYFKLVSVVNCDVNNNY